MTIEDINERIENIKSNIFDDERAHGLEDDLYAEFVEYVKCHPHDPELSEKAELILTTKQLEFSRWTA